MNKIIEELFNEFSDEDSEKLREALNYLDKNEPNIKASPEFKKNLRKRLDNIIALNNGDNVKRFWYFIVSTFAFCFTLFGVFILHKDINLFDYHSGLPIVPIIENGDDKGGEIISYTGVVGGNSGYNLNLEDIVGIEVAEMMILTEDVAEDIGKEDSTTEINEVESFEDFCTENSGRIVCTGKGKTCRINGLECVEEDYYSFGTCDFVPIS